MTIYKEYKIDNYRQAIDKIKEGILFSEITMPKDEFYKLYDYAEDSYFGEKNAFNSYLYAMSIFFTSTDETKYDFAKQILLESAKDNFALANFEISIFYSISAFNFESDEKLGFEYMQKAVKLNYPPALYEITRFYYDGIFVKKDLKKVFTYLKQAAEEGVVDAICELGAAYESGEFGEKDLDKAETLYKLGCFYKSPAAMCLLGKFYSRDDLEKKDYEKALYYLEKSYDKNYAPAAIPLAVLYINGNENSKDLQEAVKILESVYKEQNEIGQDASRLLGDLYSLPGFCEIDYQKAFDYYLMSEDGYSLNRCGEICLQGFLGTIDKKRTVDFFVRSCNAGFGEAFVNLGNCYFEGIGVDKDYSKAFEFYKIAEEYKINKALFYLGRSFEYGFGTRKNFAKAVAYYQAAANENDPKGLYRFGKILMDSSDSELKRQGYEFVIKTAFVYSYPPAMNEVALFYLKQRDVENAIKILNKSASLGNSEAFWNLAIIYSRDDYIQHDFQKTCLYLERGEKLNNAKCSYFLGFFYEKGICFKKDEQEAMRYYLKIKGDEDKPEKIYAIAMNFKLGINIDYPNYQKAEELLTTLKNTNNNYLVPYADFMLNFSKNKNREEIAFLHYFEAMKRNKKNSYLQMAKFLEKKTNIFLKLSSKDEFKNFLSLKVHKNNVFANYLCGAILTIDKTFLPEFDSQVCLSFAAENKCYSAYYWLAKGKRREKAIELLNKGASKLDSACFLGLLEKYNYDISPFEATEALINVSCYDPDASILLLKKYSEYIENKKVLIIANLIKNANSLKCFAYIFADFFCSGIIEIAMFYGNYFLSNVGTSRNEFILIMHHFYCLLDYLYNDKKFIESNKNYLINCNLKSINNYQSIKKIIIIFRYIYCIESIFDIDSIEDVEVKQFLLDIKSSNTDISLLNLSKYNFSKEEINLIEKMMNTYFDRINKGGKR